MKNTKSAVVMLGLAAAALAGSAAAQDRGAYLGGSGGIVQYKESCAGLSAPCDDKDPAWRLFAGYRFSRHFSAELAYADLGEVTSGGAAASTKAFDVSALLSFPVAQGLSAFGRLGVYRSRVKAPAAGETSSGLTYGAGLGWDFARFGVRVEWQRYDNVGGGSIGGEDTVDALLVGALFRF